MKERLIKLKFTLDRLTLRERIMILATSLLLLSVFWIFAFFLPQISDINQKRLAITEEQQQKNFFAQKLTIIKRLARDKSLQELIQTYQKLNQDLEKLQQKITRFEHRYIGSQQLSNLLYSILKETRGVSIEDFFNVPYHDENNGDAVRVNPGKGIQSAKTSKENSKTLLPAILTDLKQTTAKKMQYRLVLKGDYFSIMGYLKRLEDIPWQLYWDKLNYKVETYPQATAVIEFYTLQPTSSPIATGGTVK